VDQDGDVVKASGDYAGKNYPLVEPVEPLAPKTKKVRMRQYATKGPDGTWWTSTLSEAHKGNGWFEVPGSEIEVEVPDDVCK
jgi:hypothetical protein